MLTHVHPDCFNELNKLRVLTGEQVLTACASFMKIEEFMLDIIKSMLTLASRIA